MFNSGRLDEIEAGTRHVQIYINAVSGELYDLRREVSDLRYTVLTLLSHLDLEVRDVPAKRILVKQKGKK